MELHKAGEDYLKAILILQKRNRIVRSLDIAELLNVSKPSVCRALKLLREGGFIVMDASKRIELTDAGYTIAENVYEKNLILKRCLISMGVGSETAEKDACLMEHVICPETFEKMKAFLGKEVFQ